jgi:hypothetical protein
VLVSAAPRIRRRVLSTREVIMARRRGLRSQLYREARILGNAEALAKGPAAYGRRVARRRAYATSSSLTRRLLGAMRLSR